jgi:hypothetical protein
VLYDYSRCWRRRKPACELAFQVARSSHSAFRFSELDEENWRWELIGKHYLGKGRMEPLIRKADETGSKEYAIRDAEEYAAAHRLEISREIITALGPAK